MSFRFGNEVLARLSKGSRPMSNMLQAALEAAGAGKEYRRLDPVTGVAVELLYDDSLPVAVRVGQALRDISPSLDDIIKTMAGFGFDLFPPVVWADPPIPLREVEEVSA